MGVCVGMRIGSRMVAAMSRVSRTTDFWERDDDADHDGDAARNAALLPMLSNEYAWLVCGLLHIASKAHSISAARQE